ncbi:MAG: ABC transporter substrate-binding protein, partial [Odoribacter sp.]|nr:ABC transporter substrate-binding protein [Odoribacter sp.]
MRAVIYLTVILLLAACKQKNSSVSGHQGSQGIQVEYATGFTVCRTPEYTEVCIRDPWDTTKLLQRYVLVERGKELPAGLPEGVLVRTPLKRIVAATSVHCGWLDMLGIRKEIVGVCESRYIDVPFVQEGLKEGRIIDVGEGAAPDVERLIELNLDGMVTSPLSNAPYGRVEKTGIPQIKCVDYMESTPLGRAEWIRLLALFFDREALADSLFAETVKAYEEVKALVKDGKEHPTVVLEKKYGAVWYVSGGNSYM